MATPLPRRLVGGLLALVLAVLSLGLAAGTADAASGYRYWNYYHVQGSRYVFAKTGPGGYTPKNNTIEAYRYGTSTTANGLPPRADLSVYRIGKICGDVHPAAGKKRVGVLLDYGTGADAASGETPPKPRAACAVVPDNATGQQVLDKVAEVRYQKQLVCGIDGYPVKTCSVTVKNPPATGKAQSVAFTLPGSAHRAGSASSSGGNTGLIIAVVVVVLLAGGGLLLARRNRTARS
jgi:hypothetical protein